MLATESDWNRIVWVDGGAGRYRLCVGEAVESGHYSLGDVERMRVLRKGDMFTADNGDSVSYCKVTRKAKTGGAA